MDPKTKELVEATERLASAASGLPYEVCAASDGACSCGLIHSIPADMPVCQAYAQDEDAGAHFTHEQRVANARFIAHACTTSVALCAIVREQDARVTAAIKMAERHGMTDGGHHKMWVIDQMIRALLGDGYAEWATRANSDPEYPWDEGIAP